MIPSRKIETEIHIDAPPSRVWEVLCDGPRYAAWNPFILEMSGKPAAGERLDLRIQPAGGRATTFRPTVLVARPAEELRWLGRLVIPGLFDGEHLFRLVPERRGTRLVHAETFRGILLWVMSTDRFRHDFTAMNLALKAEAEK
jgi:hypothetical protein